MDPAPTVRAGSPIDSSSASCSDASRDRLAQARHASCARHHAGHAEGQRRLVAGGARTTPAAPRKWPPICASTRQPVPHNMVRGAMRIAMRPGVLIGQCVGDLAGPLPADPRRGDITVGRPALRRACASHMRRASSPAASRCSAISAALSSADSGCPLRWLRPCADAVGRDRISAVTRRPLRGSAGGGRRTRRLG